MKKNALSKNGLSMSQAQSISNLCYQRSLEIDRVLSQINNYTKTVEVSGKTLVLVPGTPVPTNIVELLIEKSSLNACQAFLMENIKAKNDLLRSISSRQVNLDDIEWPTKEKIPAPKETPFVGEEWGWEQLSAKELADYYEAEAFAAQIGKFIHKGGKLDVLRNELPTLPGVEWMTVEDGKKTPVTIVKHNTSEDLLTLHEELATLHRKYEGQVNYFKAKVKNLTTQKNSDIAKENDLAYAEYQLKDRAASLKYSEEYSKVSNEIKERNNKLSIEKQAETKEASNLRIEVDPRFQSIIDKFLPKETE